MHRHQKLSAVLRIKYVLHVYLNREGNAHRDATVRRESRRSDELAALEYAIAIAPSAYPVIPGTGGVRKMRWARMGMGKRGGIRVIYFYVAAHSAVLLMTAYAKNVQENLTNEQKKAIRKIAQEFEGSLKSGQSRKVH